MSEAVPSGRRRRAVLILGAALLVGVATYGFLQIPWTLAPFTVMVISGAATLLTLIGGAVLLGLTDSESSDTSVIEPTQADPESTANASNIQSTDETERPQEDSALTIAKVDGEPTDELAANAESSSSDTETATDQTAVEEQPESVEPANDDLASDISVVPEQPVAPGDQTDLLQINEDALTTNSPEQPSREHELDIAAVDPIAEPLTIGPRAKPAGESNTTTTESSDQSASDAAEEVSNHLQIARTAKSTAAELFAGEEFAAGVRGVSAGVEHCRHAASIAEAYDLDAMNEVYAVRNNLDTLLYESSEVDTTRIEAELLDPAEQELQAGNLAATQKLLTEFDAVLETVDELQGESLTIFETSETVRERHEALERELQEAASALIDERLEEAESSIVAGETELRATPETDVEASSLPTAEALLQDAVELNDDLEVERDEDISDLQTRLAEVQKTAENRYDQRERVEAALAAAERAVDSKAFESAEEAYASLVEEIDALEEHDIPQSVIEEYWAKASELEDTIAAGQAMPRIDGSLGSVEARKNQATAFIEDGEYERAVARLESALDTLDTAESLATTHNINRQEAIQSKRDELASLLFTAETQPADEIAAVLEDAENAVARGIQERDANNTAVAVAAFETAAEHYSRAVTLSTTYELPERWEVEQRESMVSEYLQTTREEAAERKRSVETDIDRQLSAAEESLTRAEQHAEVEDMVSARETLRSTVVTLDEARQLLETGVMDEQFVTRFDTLAARAEDLHEDLPAESEAKKYRTRDLVESLQQLATDIGESPLPEFVNAYGEFPADAYLEAFGSWPEALAVANLDPVDEAAHDRRKYSRVDVLDAVRDLGRQLGHPPSKAEMNSEGSISASPVVNRFGDWDTAMELAGFVETEEGEWELRERGGRDGGEREASLSDETASGSIPTNELAELYEAFGSLEAVLAALLESDGSVSEGDGSPLARWYESVFDRYAGEGTETAPNYGYQQSRRNRFTMADYRSDHGDGTQIQEFRAIKTRPLRSNHRQVFIEKNVIEPDDSYSLPVAPLSDTRLPVAVRSEEELRVALELLSEFPDWPAADVAPDDLEIESDTTDSDASGDDDTNGPSESTEIVDRLMADMGFDSEGTTAQ